MSTRWAALKAEAWEVIRHFKREEWSSLGIYIEDYETVRVMPRTEIAALFATDLPDVAYKIKNGVVPYGGIVIVASSEVGFETGVVDPRPFKEIQEFVTASHALDTSHFNVRVPRIRFGVHANNSIMKAG